MAPVDLAVSKLSRFGDADREDIEILAREKLIDARGLRSRAEEALKPCNAQRAGARAP